MRTSLLFLLLATTAAPAVAEDRASRREAARAERAERAESRQERRSEREDRGDRGERQEASSHERSDGARDHAREERREQRQESARERSAGRHPQNDYGRPTLEQRQAERQDGRDARHERRLERRVGWASRPPAVSPVPREGTQPPPPASASSGRSSAARHWNGDWRRDRRYDWYNWRSRNRSLFRLGFYFDPFGWGYRPYSIGWRLWPSYYSRSYWLNDPWHYRLPRAYPGTRWIRYYDDAILVDTWTGEVVDVIYDFFW